MTGLITVEDLGQVENEQEAQKVIDRLSELFCLQAGQDFQVKPYSHLVKVNGGIARLPVTPIVEIKSVTDHANGEPVAFELTHGLLRVKAKSHQIIEVDYVAGYDGAPEIVKSQLVDSVLRCLNVDSAAKSGATQVTKTAGPFSQSRSFAAWAVGGQIMLSPDDIALAKVFQPVKTGNIWVMEP